MTKTGPYTDAATSRRQRSSEVRLKHVGPGYRWSVGPGEGAGKSRRASGCEQVSLVGRVGRVSLVGWLSIGPAIWADCVLWVDVALSKSCRPMSSDVLSAADVGRPRPILAAIGRPSVEVRQYRAMVADSNGAAASGRGRATLGDGG